MVRYIHLLKTAIRLNSKDLSERDRTKLQKAYMAGLSIIDVAAPTLTA